MARTFSGWSGKIFLNAIRLSQVISLISLRSKGTKPAMKNALYIIIKNHTNQSHYTWKIGGNWPDCFWILMPEKAETCKKKCDQGDEIVGYTLEVQYYTNQLHRTWNNAAITSLQSDARLRILESRMSWNLQSKNSKQVMTSLEINKRFSTIRISSIIPEITKRETIGLPSAAISESVNHIKR